MAIFRMVQIALITLLLLAPLNTVAQPNERILPVRPHRQNTLVWCWGASAAMVIEYITGQRTEDCEVLSAYDRRFGGPGTCCGGDPRCLRGAMPGEIETILGQVFGIHGRSQPAPISFEEIVKSIENDKPIVIWLWRNPSSAHVVVIAGYRRPNIVVVLDPLSGTQYVPDSVLRANWMTGVWRDTILISTSRQNVSPPPPRTPMATFCATPWGSCPMMTRIPIGSYCECRMPNGIFPGQAR